LHTRTHERAEPAERVAVATDLQGERLPLPRQKTLALLVGRVTTIKLGYWAAVTVIELTLPRLLDRPFEQRLPISVALAVGATVLALLWSRWQARVVDRRAGAIDRGIATVATTFVAASVVASPASLPLLLIERARSIEGCPQGAACHFEAIWLWVTLFAVGFVLIPAVFAASLRGARTLG
jgi:predicted Kef-type K+ transport protein